MPQDSLQQRYQGAVKRMMAKKKMPKRLGEGRWVEIDERVEPPAMSKITGKPERYLRIMSRIKAGKEAK
jgi:hypothetical protein